MTVKPWAVFTTDLPDDQVEDGGEILTFGGRNVAVAIREILTRLGCDVSALRYSAELGWEFGAGFKGRRISCLISSFHPTFFFNFDDPQPAWRSRGSDSPAYEEIALNLNAALAQDPRFHDIQWYSREDGPPAPPDHPDPPAAGLSRKELFAQGLALEIVERRPPLTASQYIWRVLIGGGFWLGLCALWGGAVSLTRGDFLAVILLPAGVLMIGLAAIGTLMIVGGSAAPRHRSAPFPKR